MIELRKFAKLQIAKIQIVSEGNDSFFLSICDRFFNKFPSFLTDVG